MPKIVMVPVPVERLDDVYTVLANKQQNNHVDQREVDELPMVGYKQPDRILIRRAYTQSTAEMRRIFDYLAERPGQWVSSPEVREALGMSLSDFRAWMSAFGKRWRHRYGQDHDWPFKIEGSGAHVQQYWMAPEIAEIVRTCAQEAA